MSYFSERLEAFPRIEPYRLAQASTATGRTTRRSRARRRPGSRSRAATSSTSAPTTTCSLSYHPDVIAAAQAATARFGTGVTGSRLLNGTLPLHRELEAELADFYGREAALVFPTGYVANLCGIAGFLDRHDYAIVDKEAHNSLLTGVRLSGASMKRFRHNDVDQLDAILGDAPRPKPARASSSTASTRWAATPRRSTRSSSCAGATPEHVPPRRRGPRARRARPPRDGAPPSSTACSTTSTSSRSRSRRRSARAAARSSAAADAIELLTLDSDPFIFTASNTPASIAAALAALRILRAEPRPARSACATTSPPSSTLLAERGVPHQPGRERDRHDPAASATTTSRPSSCSATSSSSACS